MIDPIKDPRGAVAEFMKASGRDTLPDGSKPPPDRDIALGRSLILEEIRGFTAAADAYERHPSDANLIAIADGLADTVYVLLWAAIVWGVKSGYNSLAPDGIAAALASKHRDRIVVEVHLLQGFKFYLHGATASSPATIKSALSDCLRAACVAADFYRIPLAAVFAEVHRSNMTKVVDGKCITRDDGKILKPATYEPPDIAGVLRAHGRIA